MAYITVSEYFKKQLGRNPEDATLSGLSINSPCGKDCVKVIDAAKNLLAVADPHPDVVNPILKGTNAAVEVFWRG